MKGDAVLALYAALLAGLWTSSGNVSVHARGREREMLMKALRGAFAAVSVAVSIY